MGERIAATGDRLSAAFALEVARVWRTYERQVVSWMGRIVDGPPLAVQRERVRALLTEAGFDDVAAAVANASVEQMAQAIIGPRNIPIASLETRLEALRRMVLADLFADADEASIALWRAVRWQMLGRQPLSEILAGLTQALDKSEARVRTIFDTQVSILGRQVEAIRTEDLGPEQPYLYTGPIDDKTRDFCLERVGQVFTRAQIAEMDNGQMANVFVTGGGWNCRHSFLAVESQALRSLAGTGEVAQVYQAELDRARQRRAA